MYEFRPMHLHYDGGLGATGEAFKEAADCLSASTTGNRFLHSDIPICYLYRHAIELYLKSIILVIHRRLRLDGALNNTRPQLKVGNKWKFLDRLHSIGVLYACLKALLHEQKDRLSTLCNTKWDSFPQEVDTWIDAIESEDTRSTFFRYPTLGNIDKDRQKSDFEESSAEEILKRIRSTGQPAKVYIEEQGDGHAEVYAYVGDRLKVPKEALMKAAEFLSAVHFGVRMELADGN